ncbi:MAG: hypothetical protein A2X64_06580 [Ignavibacteria bacterium GWF2_33_9]|nr:MAG: hypothetical protein A2X64_06580 [Ignavibacteria bacterium GWF2_33_9]
MYIIKEKVELVFNSLGIEPSFYEHRNQLTALIPQENLVDFMNELKHNKNTKFDMCVDVTAVDWAKAGNRYEVIYLLYSNENQFYLHVKTPVEETHPKCPSVTSVWASANWYERETYDMYGIKFENHPFLRRFYMPEDFKDPETKEPIFPLRKDVPMMGIPDAMPLPPYPEKYGDLK